MRLRHTLSAVAMALAAAACSGNEPNGVIGVLLTAPDDAGSVPVVMVDELVASAWPSHPGSRIRAADLDGDTLRLDYEYGGGCRVHTFALVVSRTWMESYPVQTRALLAHDGDGDLCRRLVRQEIAVDLSPVAAAYTDSYGAESDTVIIHLSGWDRPIRYAF